MKRFHLLLIGAIIALAPTLEIYGQQKSSRQRLQALLDDNWEFQLDEYPMFATRMGKHDSNHRLTSMTLADIERRKQKRKQFLAEAKSIPLNTLNSADRLNLQIFRRLLQDDVTEDTYPIHLIPISNRYGFHISFPELYKQVPLKTVNDYENYISRLRDFQRYTDEHITLLKKGIEAEWVLPSIVLEGYEGTIRPHIVSDATKSLLYTPFRKLPASLTREERTNLQKKGQEAILQSVVPAYQAFDKFMTDEYMVAARGSVGTSALPRGREFYRHRVKHFTTLDMTPEQVHELGKQEVTRIKAEMRAVPDRANFKGSLDDFLQFLREDKQFYATTPEQLEKEVALALKKMDGQLPKLFKTLPRMPYGIRRIPDYIAPKTTSAYYSQPSGDGTQAGFYYINTYNLKSRPLFEVEALSLHEAVPGHHLQLALQQELKDLPNFRRYAGFTAFVEGWALYAERLGLEVGFYQDPYSDFGRLSYEMWRACRLVVDTGIHYLGWSRSQAITYMTENTALSLHNIESEVDRYIAWPGQALAYKIGELKIRELRRLTEQQLGDAFDIREFHHVVLKDGSLPLPLLEQNVKQYIATQKP
jgi:uncharacterized protein (DUF885 family)